MSIVITDEELAIIQSNESMLSFITDINILGYKSSESLPYKGIYKLTNIINNKSYVGRSKDCGSRYHDYNTGVSSTLYMAEALKLYGNRHFTFEILDVKNDAELESFYMRKFNTVWPNGYNKRHRS